MASGMYLNTIGPIPEKQSKLTAEGHTAEGHTAEGHTAEGLDTQLRDWTHS